MEPRCDGHHENGGSKPHPFSSGVAGNILYPCSNANTQIIQQQMANDNRMLWAALTPNGTRHFMSDPAAYPVQDDHYEVIDYEIKQQQNYAQSSPSIRKTPVKVRNLNIKTILQ